MHTDSRPGGRKSEMRSPKSEADPKRESTKSKTCRPFSRKDAKIAKDNNQ